MTSRQKKTLRIGLMLGMIAMLLIYMFARPLWYPLYVRIEGRRTVADVLEDIGPATRTTLSERFSRENLSYPPDSITFLAIKDEAKLEIWAAGIEPESTPTLIHTYPILAASGHAGPKLREGDRQVPEGIYRIEGLNPNSSYHLSMKLDYPNAFDLKHARAEGRTQPGSDIFIHGKAASIGCLAMGDEAIEELFVLVHDVGHEHVRVVIAPTDPRSRPLEPIEEIPWTETLYDEISQHFSTFSR